MAVDERLQGEKIDFKFSQFNVVVQVSERKYIIYNTAIRSIVLVDAEVFNSLKRGAFNEIGEGDIFKLKQAGVIVKSDLDESAQMEYSIAQTKYGRMRALTLFVSFTSQCNLRCVYCFQDQRSNVAAALDQSKLQSLLRFIDREVEARALKQVNVVFFGGEPLVNQEMVIAAAEELSKRNSEHLSIDVSLITNGTLLNETMSRWLAKHVNFVQITLDGPKSIHDKRRPYRNGAGTYEIIMNNLIKAVELFHSVGVHCVVDRENVAFVPELLMELEENGLKRKNLSFSFSPAHPTQSLLISCPKSAVDLEQARMVADLFSMVISQGWHVPFPFLKGPCGRVQMDFMAVDEKLQVYKCPGELYGPHPDGVIKPDGKLVITGLNWFESVSFSPTCAAKCIYGPICYGGCRWLAGGPKRTLCSKQALDATIGDMLVAYVRSRYRDRLL